MIQRIKDNILRILKQTIKAIHKQDIKQLKDLSNNTVHDSTVFQDEHSIEIAVLIYSLSKIFERSKYQQYKDWNIFQKTALHNLKKAYQNLKNNKDEQYHKNIRYIFSITSKLETNLKKYIKEILEKGKIVKGSRVYEHGISAGRTAKLLNISEWDLLDYTGKTGISDVTLSKTKSIKERLEFTRGLFKWIWFSIQVV